MKNFLLDILIVFLLLSLIDFIVGMVAEKLINNLKESSSFGEIKHAIKDITPDILIVGSSRAKSHYVPGVLMDSLTMTVYNAGSDGKNILYHSCIVNAIVNRKPPKLIIMDLNIEEFQLNFNDRLSVLNPFYNYDSLCHETINLKSSNEWIKMKSNLYRYNSCFLTIFYNSIKGGENKSLGYRALPVNGVIPFPGKINNRDSIDTVIVNRFIWLIELIIQNNIKVVVNLSPYYGSINKNVSSLKLMEEICHNKDIPFFNYSQSQYFIDRPVLFKDANHLNSVGAEIYSKMVAKDLKSVLIN